MGSKKSMSSKKKGTHTFFRAEHCAKKSMGSQKKGTHTFGYFFAGTFFLFELKISSNKKKVPGKTDFAGTVFFV